jgi:hypothetical protein
MDDTVAFVKRNGGSHHHLLGTSNGALHGVNIGPQQALIKS